MSRQPLPDREKVFIIAWVAGKEFALADVIKMEKASIPVLSTPEQVADALAIMYRHQKKTDEQGVTKARSTPHFSSNFSPKSVLISLTQKICRIKL